MQNFAQYGHTLLIAKDNSMFRLSFFNLKYFVKYSQHFIFFVTYEWAQ
jgi:hypothetical protein